MQELTLKEKIIKVLIESPQTTGDIAKTLNYIDKNGNGKYNVVADDLSTLCNEGIITFSRKKIKGRRGPPPACYKLNVDIDVLKKTVDKYQSIVPDLQDNWDVLGVVCSEHSDFIEHMIELDTNIPIKFINEKYIEGIKGNFMYCMQQSTTFFKKCLLNDSHKIEDLFATSAYFVGHIINNKHQVSGLPSVLDIGYRGCVVADSLELDETTKASGSYGRRTLINKIGFSFERFISPQHQFSWKWDQVPGNDSDKLRLYLSEQLSMEWVKNATFSKSDNNKKIYISDEKNTCVIKVDNEHNKVFFESSDGHNYIFYGVDRAPPHQNFKPIDDGIITGVEIDTESAYIQDYGFIVYDILRDDG